MLAGYGSVSRYTWAPVHVLGWSAGAARVERTLRAVEVAAAGSGPGSA